MNGLSDPYVKVYENSKKLLHTTAVQEDTLSPVWEEIFTTTSYCGNTLTFKIYDKDLVTDDYLGECQIDLQPDLDKESGENMPPIKSFDEMVVDFYNKKKPKKGNGKLTITVRHLGFA